MHKPKRLGAMLQITRNDLLLIQIVSFFLDCIETHVQNSSSTRIRTDFSHSNVCGTVCHREVAEVVRELLFPKGSHSL